MYEGAAIAQEIGDRHDEGIWLGNLGHIYRNLGQYKPARECYEQAQGILETIQSPVPDSIYEWLHAFEMFGELPETTVQDS
ncbi:MAG: hypothetical protein GY803_25420 [Chloroflexi bacterium]|nr:hypothetical protein [Chloroflexota bacterium]